MLSEHVVLEGSRDYDGKSRVCSRCDNARPTIDGVNLGTRWVCGRCWRNKATRPQGAIASLAQEKRKAA